MKETSYQILTSTLLFLTKLVNKKKKNTSFMYDKARARCSQVQTQLLFNWFHFFSQRQSCDFPTLFQSFLFYLHACPRKLAKQNTVFYKTTGTVGSIIRFRNVNHTCRYTHTHKYSPLAMYSMCRPKRIVLNPSALKFHFKRQGLKQSEVLFSLENSESVRKWGRKKSHILVPGGTPLYKLYRVGFLRRFGLKTGMHFAHFGLESGMVFEGTTECMNVFIVSIPNE